MVSITSLGTALPRHYRTNDQYIEHAKSFSCTTKKQERVLEELYRRTTIAHRGSVLTAEAFPAGMDSGPTTGHRMRYYENEIGELALSACKRATDAAVQRPYDSPYDSFTHIVTVSCTGFFAPGFDIHLVQSLGLPPSTQRTHVGFMGCHGGMNGLRVAKAYAEQRDTHRILLCMAEACSLHFQYGWEADHLVANSLFADGAAALVIEQSAGNGIEIVDSASYIIPNTLDAMMWRIGDNGFEMTLSPQVPDIIESLLAPWLNEWLAIHELSVDAVASWAVHPGGPKILDAVQNCLALSVQAIAPSREILAAYGNMSSPTVFFILEKLKTQGTKGPCVMLGFGPGLTVEAALIKL